MQRSSRFFRSLFILAVTLFTSSAPLAGEKHETVTLRGDVKEDTYLAGGSVYALANIAGDLVVAGGQIEIEEEVREDVLAAGGKVSVRARVGDDVRAAGGEVTLDNFTSGDAIAAGGRVTLGPDATVGGRAWLAGGTVEVYGNVGKELRVAGGRIVISGTVKGDVLLYGDDIEVLPDAVIDGNLHYRSHNEAKIDSGAKISGAVVRDETPRPHKGGHVGAKLFFIASLALTAIAFFLLFPVASLGGARAITDSPWKSLGLGLLLLIAVPIAAVVLCVTFIGLWLGLATLFLYFLLLLSGYLTGVIFVSEFGLSRFVKRKKPTKSVRALAIAIALAVIGIVCMIPVVGKLAEFVVLLAGIGGFAIYATRRYKKAK